MLEKESPWAPADRPWPGSAGDFGSPGERYLPSTPTPTPTMTPTVTPTPTPTPTPEPTSTPTATPGLPPRLFISELLANPQQAPGAAGEWLELANPNDQSINLQGWQLSTHSNQHLIVASDVIVPPTGYVVLGADGDPNHNGGVALDYVDATFELPDDAGHLDLLSPDGVIVDSVAWGPAGDFIVTPGCSSERTLLEAGAVWAPAWRAWPGSAGDFGTPRLPYAAAPPHRPWQFATGESPLQIEEVAFDGSREEYVVLLNIRSTVVVLENWLIGDAETPGDGEGLYYLPRGRELAPAGLYIIAREAAAFTERFGRTPDAEFEESDPNVPNLERNLQLGRGEWGLNDSGDEVVLINPDGYVADAMAYGAGDVTQLGLAGQIDAPSGYTVQRVPGVFYPAVPDLRHRFLAAPPTPFAAVQLPAPKVHQTPTVAHGYLALWGTAGAASNYTAGATAPPHYVLAAAAAQGLDFAAIADLEVYALPALPPPLTALPAWLWRSAGEGSAILYNNFPQAGLSLNGLTTYLATQPVAIQWVDPAFPPAVETVALAAGDGDFDVKAWFERWKSAGAPLLPAGNSTPDLPGEIAVWPQFTGILAFGRTAVDVLTALNARRGWLTSQPGLWLTLEVQREDGQVGWMGSWQEPANQAEIRITYGDTAGAGAGLALWQDGVLVRQLENAPSNTEWNNTLPLAPGSILAAVATQRDGDYAISAPIWVRPTGNGAALLNELLPSPRTDANGDGAVDTDDEFIELYNPGDTPLNGAGWQIVLNPGAVEGERRFTLPNGVTLRGGDRLALFASATHLHLPDAGGEIQLVDVEGLVRDVANWDATLPAGRTQARVPDGQNWDLGADVTPGRPNTNVAKPSLPRRHEDGDKSNASGDDSTAPMLPELGPTAGQAGGPPGSIAQSKLAGLKAWVEFDAVVVAPPSLFNSSIYVADIAPDGVTAGIGINVFLHHGDFPPLAEGDIVRLAGKLASYRGEMELSLDGPEQIWRVKAGNRLNPLTIQVGDVGESLEGRLVTVTGVVTGWQGDSIFLADPTHLDVAAARITVRSSLKWRRPRVEKGERWMATGVVNQFGRTAPWNDGYRVLVRYREDLVKVEEVEQWENEGLSND
ncbi:MAG: lamin tail domain-containing protein [Anaerolineales bacterium]|nr:lamin tail domain-containing protein [Anaerolineales bacterium]